LNIGDQEALRLDFQRIRQFLDENAQASQLPWFHSFPKNSCESSSAYLARALEKRHPKLEVSVAKGTGSEGHHFWVEFNGYVMDLTADQFEGCESPLFDFAPNPLQGQYWEVEHMSAEIAWANLGTGCVEFMLLLLKSLEVPFCIER
jgi:hypothetical protein